MTSARPDALTTLALAVALLLGAVLGAAWLVGVT